MSNADTLFAEALAHSTPTVPWLEGRRAEAVKAFQAKGVPHRRVEDWKYTDLRTALESANDLGADTIALSPRIWDNRITQ